MPSYEQKADPQTLEETAAHLRLVINRAARRMRQEAGTEMRPSRASALVTVELHGPLTPSELAEIERVKRPTATRILRGLEGGGPDRAHARPQRWAQRPDQHHRRGP